MPEDKRGDCWWLVLRDGTLVAGDEGGGVALFTELRVTRPLGRVLRAVRASVLINRFDELVARHRSRLGRFVTEGPAPRRYP